MQSFITFVAAALAAAQVLAPTSAAPIHSTRSHTASHTVHARAQLDGSTNCMMQRADMSLNLAAAMNSMTMVQSAFNSSDVQNVQDGIMGAMRSLTALTGAMANGVRVNVAIPNAMVNNVTMSLTSLDNVNGVPDATTADQLTTARQQLENASQNAMGISANCVNTGGAASGEAASDRAEEGGSEGAGATEGGEGAEGATATEGSSAPKASSAPEGSSEAPEGSASEGSSEAPEGSASEGSSEAPEGSASEGSSASESSTASETSESAAPSAAAEAMAGRKARRSVNTARKAKQPKARRANAARGSRKLPSTRGIAAVTRSTTPKARRAPRVSA